MASLCASVATNTSETLTADASQNVFWTPTAHGTRTVTTTSARTRVPASVAQEQNVMWQTTSLCATALKDTPEIRSRTADQCHKRHRRVSLSTPTPACHRHVARTPSAERQTTQPCALACLVTMATQPFYVDRSASPAPNALRPWRASTRSARILAPASAVPMHNVVSSITARGATVYQDMKAIPT